MATVTDPPWLNRTNGIAPRNGTTSHTIAFGFTPTAGSLLVVFASGAVTHAAAGWTERQQPVDSGELSMFTKTAAGGDNIVITHNGSNYPIEWAAYEFPAGSTHTASTGISSTVNTFPTLSGLPGTPQVIIAAFSVNHSSTTGAGSATWASPWVEGSDLDTPKSGTDGSFLTTARQINYTGTSVTPTATITLSPAGSFAPDKQKIVAAFDMAAIAGAAPSAGTASGSTSWAGAGAGKRTPKGTGSGTTARVGVASGVAPAVGVNTGAAAGATSWVGASSGTAARRGTAAGGTAWVGVASGKRPVSGSAAGATTWAGTASGVAPTGLTIAQENALTGNPLSQWAISGAGDDGNVGFARQFSTNVGGTVQFSCAGNGTVIDVYRVGYYAGNGSRRVATITNTPASQPAAATIPNSGGAVTCTAWSVTASWTIPATHTSGLHIAVFRNASQTNASWIPFMVRDDARAADIIVKTSDTTWGSAYNGYGGRSLYGSYDANGTSWANGAWDTATGRGYAVDYHRPIATRQVHPVTYWDNAEQPLIAYLERNGFNVKYVSSRDVDSDPSCLDGAKVIISSGHDEYWTQGMRDAFIAARDSGQHLLMMSGNELFWRTRQVGSVQWCYKDTMPGLGGHVAGTALDPVSWTGTWRDTRRPGGAEPESEVTGTFFRMNGIVNENVMLTPAAHGVHPVWRNSSLVSSNVTLTGVIGFEADEMAPQQPPASRSVLASRTFNISGRADDNGQIYDGNGPMAWGVVSQRYSSGAVVVGFGTIQWAWALDNLHRQGGAYANTAAQQMMLNLLVDLGAAAPATPMSGVTTSAPAALSSYGALPVPPSGTATGGTTWTGTASGTRPSRGSASGATTWTGTAAGKRTPKGAATGGTAWAGAATGARTASGSAAGATGWAGAATGARPSKGTAAGATTWDGTADGYASTRGTATGSTTWAGTAAGVAPVAGQNTGTASGSTTWTGAASGSRKPVGTVAGATVWTGTATGGRPSSGIATGSTAWTGAASGTTPTVAGRTGTTTGATAWLGTAVGARTSLATATGATTWIGTALGQVEHHRAPDGYTLRVAADPSQLTIPPDPHRYVIGAP